MTVLTIKQRDSVRGGREGRGKQQLGDRAQKRRHYKIREQQKFKFPVMMKV